MNTFSVCNKINIFYLKIKQYPMVFSNFYNKFFLIILLLHSSPVHMIAQIPFNIRSTLSITGKSDNVTFQGRKFVVQQSIGQPGVIGINSNSNLMLRQGFIQPPLNASNLSSKSGLKASFYPNPVFNTLIISFSEDITSEINITLFNLFAKKILNRSYSPTQEITIDLSTILSGFYLLKVDSGDKTLTKKVVKY